MLNPSQINRVVQMALDEDMPWGDLTAQSLIPSDAQAYVDLVAREAGTFAGGAVFQAAFALVDAGTRTTIAIDDGATFTPGTVLATVRGTARSILAAERVALNFVQHLSGIATETARYVAEVSHTRARITDTRKTTPGLRILERHAVRAGGGHNHRFCLSDAVMAKDNHLGILAEYGHNLTDALRSAQERLPHTTHIEVEVDRLDQVDAVLAAGVGTIMLDNFSLDDLRAGVEKIAGRTIVEASGGVNLKTVRAIAETGVDVISVGALTHSVRAIDLGLDFHAEMS